MEFWPTFDIFHQLRQYLCSKREVLGFYKQVTYMRPSNEPFFLLSGPPVLAGVCRKMAHFWPKRAKHGRLTPDSTKASGKALMGHTTSTCMGIHALGSFSSLATPKNGRKWPKNCPFLTKKSQAWQACSWLNQTKWKRFDGPYDIYIDRKTCVRALLLIDNTQKWPKMTQKLPFFDQKKRRQKMFFFIYVDVIWPIKAFPFGLVESKAGLPCLVFFGQKRAIFVSFSAIFGCCQWAKGPLHMFSYLCRCHMAHQNVSIWFGWVKSRPAMLGFFWWKKGTFCAISAIFGSSQWAKGP